MWCVCDVCACSVCGSLGCVCDKSVWGVLSVCGTCGVYVCVRSVYPLSRLPLPIPASRGQAHILTHLCSGHSEPGGVCSRRRPGGSLSSPFPTAEQLATILAHICLSHLICKVVSVTDPQERPVGLFQVKEYFPESLVLQRKKKM